MPDDEYRKRMAQLKIELGHPHPRSRVYAAKSICTEALVHHKPERIEKLLKRRDVDVKSSVLATLKKYLLTDKYRLDTAKVDEVQSLRKEIWTIGMSSKKDVAEQALKLLRFMEGF